MPLPLLWAIGAAAVGVAGYIAKKNSESGSYSSSSYSSNDDDEENRLSKLAEAKREKDEKQKTKKALEQEFSTIGEQYKNDIILALEKVVSVELLATPTFQSTIKDSPSKKNFFLTEEISPYKLEEIMNEFYVTLKLISESNSASISWADKNCNVKARKNLIFFIDNYAVSLKPTTLYNDICLAIDQSSLAISKLKEKRTRLKELEVKILQCGVVEK